MSRYLLGSDQKELLRLEKQHQLWADEARALWKRAGFGKNKKVLDMGCGPGFAAIELAKIMGSSGRVVAADISKPYIDYLNDAIKKQCIDNIQTICSDIHEISVEPSYFDGAYCRFFLIFFNQPEKIIQKVHSVLKPGGVWAMTDFANYDMSISPRKKSIDKIMYGVQECFRKHGGDLSIQMEMPKLLGKNGFEVKEIKPVVKVARPNTDLWSWDALFIENFSKELIKSQCVTEAEVGQFWVDWKAISKDPNAFFITPTLLDIIAIKK